MPFLRIQTVTIPVFSDKLTRKIVRQGFFGRAGVGDAHAAQWGTRRKWTGTACWLQSAHNFLEGQSFQSLISGDGHYVRFSDGFQTSTSLMPEPRYRDVYVDTSATNTFTGSTARLQER